MKSPFRYSTTALALAVSLLTLALHAQEKPAGAEPEASPATGARRADPLPEGLHGFSGHLSGKLLSKDIEKGSLVMRVHKLLNVWKGNKASQPKAAEGRTLAVSGIHGPALDVLVVLKPGDFFEIETQHVRGDEMVYLGEGIKKITAPSGEETASREVLHGFRGMFVGELISKDQEKGTLAVKIQGISKVWKANKAANAEAAVGQTWKINGVTGKWLDVLLTLKAGDRVEIEAFHRRGDELDFVGEWLKKVE